MLLTGRQPNELYDSYSNTWKWRNYVPNVGNPLASVIDRMLLPSPCDRYQSAAEVLEALKQPFAPIPVSPVSPPSPHPRSFLSPPPVSPPNFPNRLPKRRHPATYLQNLVASDRRSHRSRPWVARRSRIYRI